MKRCDAILAIRARKKRPPRGWKICSPLIFNTFTRTPWPAHNCMWTRVQPGSRRAYASYAPCAACTSCSQETASCQLISPTSRFADTSTPSPISIYRRQLFFLSILFLSPRVSRQPRAPCGHREVSLGFARTTARSSSVERTLFSRRI